MKDENNLIWETYAASIWNWTPDSIRNINRILQGLIERSEAYSRTRGVGGPGHLIQATQQTLSTLDQLAKSGDENAANIKDELSKVFEIAKNRAQSTANMSFLILHKYIHEQLIPLLQNARVK